MLCLLTLQFFSLLFNFYSYEHDTDKNMTVLKFVDDNGNDLGMIKYVIVHVHVNVC